MNETVSLVAVLFYTPAALLSDLKASHYHSHVHVISNRYVVYTKLIHLTNSQFHF